MLDSWARMRKCNRGISGYTVGISRSPIGATNRAQPQSCEENRVHTRKSRHTRMVDLFSHLIKLGKRLSNRHCMRAEVKSVDRSNLGHSYNNRNPALGVLWSCARTTGRLAQGCDYCNYSYVLGAQSVRHYKFSPFLNDCDSCSQHHKFVCAPCPCLSE